MSNSTKVDLSLLKSYKSSFDNEKQRYMYNAYNTFSGGYVSHCGDKYVQRMKANLSYHYDGISSAYSKINNWWTNYNNDLDNLEKGLSNDRATGSGIKESSVVAGVNALPSLSNLYLDSFYTFEERKKKGEELKLHYSQKAVPVTPLTNPDGKQPRFSNDVKKEKVNFTGDYEAPVIETPWYKKVGKGVMDFGSAAWGIFESGLDLAFTGIGNGLTYVKTYVGCGLGQSVSFFRILKGDLTWKDVDYANRQAWEEANAEVRERNARHEAKVDKILNHVEEKRLNYTWEDYCDTLPADVADVGYNFGKGVVGVGEKVRDALESTGSIVIQPIYYGIGKANGLSNEEIKKNMNAQREETMAEIADDECQIYMFDDIEQSEAGQWVQEHSDLTDEERGLAQGVGEMAGQLALSYVMGGALASHGTTGLTSLSTASKAIASGEAMTPLSMGIVGGVTGYGSGVQEAYADGAGYWQGIGYAGVNAVIEGSAWAAGGATNKFVYRAENMGSKYIMKGVLARITLDTGAGVTEAYSRTLAHGIYKRKEDGSSYTIDELYEMYGGDEAIQQNFIMSFGGSFLGEMGEMRQAFKLSQMENVLASGDPKLIADQMKNYKAADYNNFAKYATAEDITTVVKYADDDLTFFLTKNMPITAVESVIKQSDNKTISKIINNVDDDLLVNIVKNADDDQVLRITKSLSTKEQIIALRDGLQGEDYKRMIDIVSEDAKRELAKVDKKLVEVYESAIKTGDKCSAFLGYEEHNFIHVTRVAGDSKEFAEILDQMIKDGQLDGYGYVDPELIYVAGLFHDAGMTFTGTKCIKFSEQEFLSMSDVPKLEVNQRLIVDDDGKIFVRTFEGTEDVVFAEPIKELTQKFETKPDIELEENQRIVKVKKKIDGEEQISYELRTYEKGIKASDIIDEDGILIRKQHPYNSALTTLKLASDLGDNVDTDMVAVLTYLHSKSSSGVKNLASTAQISDCLDNLYKSSKELEIMGIDIKEFDIKKFVNLDENGNPKMIEVKVDKFNNVITDPNFDGPTVTKYIYDIKEEALGQIKTGAASLRVGDAHAIKTGRNHATNAIHIITNEPTTVDKNWFSEYMEAEANLKLDPENKKLKEAVESVFRDQCEKEVFGKDITVGNHLLDDTKKGELFSKRIIAGERNTHASGISVENGEIVYKHVVLSNDCPTCTWVHGLKEKFGEYATYSKTGVKQRVVIELPPDVTDGVKALYTEFANDFTDLEDWLTIEIR